jgi:hypothetical protein
MYFISTYNAGDARENRLNPQENRKKHLGKSAESGQIRRNFDRILTKNDQIRVKSVEFLGKSAESSRKSTKFLGKSAKSGGFSTES